MTVRSHIYDFLRFRSGYKVKSFNNGLYIPVNKYEFRENDDDVDGNLTCWPVGSQTK